MLDSDLGKCLQTAVAFEFRTVQEAPNREAYEMNLKRKLEDIQQKRAQRANPMMQHGMPVNPNMNMPPNVQNMHGMAGMNMANAMGMPNGQMNMNDPMQHSGFPAHLQRPMQPSPMPRQPSTMDPSHLQQNNMQHQMPNMNQGQPQQPQNFQQGNPGPLGQPSQQETQNWAKNLYDKMPETKKAQIRANVMKGFSEQQKATAIAEGDLYVMKFLFQKSQEMIIKSRMQGQQRGANGGPMQMGGQQNMSASNGQQPSASQPDFSTFLGQQANAMKQQESGEQVVPASNNANFMGAGMNVPQGVNPQMLGNQQANPQMTNQMPQLMMQQQKQQMMQRQNALAQQQALQQQQQANQLRGQPGGLNAPNALNGGPPGQAGSPEMSMLNRPIGPSNQASSTPQQQNRPPSQQLPPTPQNTANLQLLQHHQQMMSQGGPQGQVGGPQQISEQQRNTQLQQMLSSLPPHIREKLAHTNWNPDQLRQFIMQFQQKAQQQGRNMMNGQPGQPGQPGVPPNMAMPMNQMPPGMMNNMAGSNMQGNATPSFNSQPPHTQHPQQAHGAQLQQRPNQQSQHLKQRAMDSRPFPKELLSQLNIPVPPDVLSWGRLKQHLMNNMPRQVVQRVMQAQLVWFEERPEEMNAALHALRQHVLQQQAQVQGHGTMPGHPGQPQPVSGPMGMPMPNGQAPPAQMVPPSAQMQQAQSTNQGPFPPGANQGGLRPPPLPQPSSIEEIQAFRGRYVQLQGKSDDEVKTMIWNHKQKNYTSALHQFQQQEALRNAQIQRAQPPVGQQGNMPQNAAPVQHPPQQPQRPQQIPTPQQGQKRPQPTPSSDDVVEIPNPNQRQPQQLGAPQAPSMQSGKPQQQSRPQPPQMPSKEQLAKMPREQQQQFVAAFQRKQQAEAEALRKAQMGVGNNNQSQTQAQPPLQHPNGQPPAQPNAQNSTQPPTESATLKYATMFKELERRFPKGPAVQIDAAGLQRSQEIMRKLWPQMTKSFSSLRPALQQFPRLENVVRAMMKAFLQFRQNCADEHGNFKDYLSLTVPDLQQMEQVIVNYFMQIKMAKESKSAADSKRQQPEQAQTAQQGGQAATASAQPKAKRQPASQPLPTPPAQQQQQQQGNARKLPSNNKAPPAPTENKTFDWGPSPHGVPKYDQGRSELTSDKLKIPNKKRKHNQSDSPASTPAAPAGTPGIAAVSPGAPVKAPSPEQLKRQQQVTKQEVAEREKEAAKEWRCDDQLCDGSVSGFESQEELTKHLEAEHKPVDDPLEFLLAQEAKMLPVTPESNGKEQSNARLPPGLHRVVKSQTPGVKQEVATPATAGAKPESKTPIATQPAEAKKEKTLQEAMEEKIGFTRPTSPSAVALVTEDDSLWQNLLNDTFDPLPLDINDWTCFNAPPGGTVDWGLRPDPPESSPDLTPSSGTSTGSSGRESDISHYERLKINMEWDPWGTGDTQVPEALRNMTGLGLSDPQQQAKSGGVDTDMPDAEAGKVAEKKSDDDLDWSRDENDDWELLFGRQLHEAGMDGIDWGSI